MGAGWDAGLLSAWLARGWLRGCPAADQRARGVQAPLAARRVTFAKQVFVNKVFVGGAAG